MTCFLLFLESVRVWAARRLVGCFFELVVVPRCTESAERQWARYEAFRFQLLQSHSLGRQLVLSPLQGERLSHEVFLQRLFLFQLRSPPLSDL